jgi:hypothetical protein
MKSTSLALACLVLAIPVLVHARDRIVPAGALIECTISEPHFNSKTAAVGDPVLCKAGYTGRYSPFALPYNSYLVGRFEDYKDPGHLVGKGWMDLAFDHIVVEPDIVIPLDAKVVDVPGYKIDRQGRILGKGHPVRDTVEWMIPILWPIDLINLPRRGPRPTLKSETRLTLKVMDDFSVPAQSPLQEDSPGLLRRTPSAYSVPQETDPQPAPVMTPISVTAPDPPPAGDPYRPPYVPDRPPQAVYYYYGYPYYGYAYGYTPPRPVYMSPYGQAWVAPQATIVVRDGVAYPVYGQ